MINILDSDDGAGKIIKLPKTPWGDDLYAKNFGLEQWLKFREMSLLKQKGENISAEIWALILTVCDSEGVYCFNDSSYEALTKKNPIIASRLANYIIDEFNIFETYTSIEKKDAE